MQNKPVRFGPIALSATLTTNILNPGTTTGGVNMPATSGNLYFLIKHIRIVNKTGTAATAFLWIGATGANAAGTEFGFQGTVIPANSYVDFYPGTVTLDVADFLVGGASSATTLTIEGSGEIGIR